jgi:hypothetical protein
MMIPGLMRHPASHAVLLSILVAGLTTGCLGLWRGDYYAGITNGGLDTCVPFNFDVSIEEGAQIRGLAATTYPWGTVSWEVTGAIVEGDIHLQTRAADPRAPQQLIRWGGSRRAISLEVTEEGTAPGCSAPRTAVLNRK